ncbi:PREDICTED: uncharacterized protein LOC108712236 [Pelobates cultripes]|uniref:PREDICTED: uncharacterized protein LOC108712236 n=1 Tax=Pelobates cultripes TaxID=61616 RepID=A0AAD1S6J8_PELCU|nr:PREDICTED: uncharacterized protein LOC108712236 [Pelobates cultripes]
MALGLYQTLTSSTLTTETMQSLLRHVYPKETPEKIAGLSRLVISEMDDADKGFIDEDQFVSWIQAMPQTSIASILSFPVIPPDLESSHTQSSPSVPTASVLAERGRVRDDQLHNVATLMVKRKRDWKMLANRIGFLEKDSRFFEQAHPEVKDQILDLLLVWRNAAGEQGQSQTLQDALKHTGNADIANEIFSLEF